MARKLVAYLMAVDQSGRQTVVFGARGDAHLEITVYGPVRPVHSGHYGNWVPNPAMMLSQLLTGITYDTCGLQHIINDNRSHGVEFEVTLRAGDGYCGIISNNLDADHDHRFFLSWVDLSRHN